MGRFTRTILFFGFCLIALNACKEVKEKKTTTTISPDEYFIEYGTNNPDVYYHANNARMDGHFVVKKDTLTKEEFGVSQGYLDGEFKSYYPNGKLANSIVYKKGRKDGKDIFYYQSGKVKRESVYADNKLIGISREYRENGEVYIEREYVDDKMVSRVYSNGLVAGEEFDLVVDGKNMSVSRMYDANGNLKLAVGFEMEDNTMKNDMLYILDENNRITDSIDPEKDKMKALQLMMTFGKGF